MLHMVHTKLKALLACVCVMACVIGFSQGVMFSATADKKDGAVAKETFDLGGKTEVVVENENLKFTFDVENCFFKVEDLNNPILDEDGKVTGYKTWYSNPTYIWGGRPEEEPVTPAPGAPSTTTPPADGSTSTDASTTVSSTPTSSTSTTATDATTTVPTTTTTKPQKDKWDEDPIAKGIYRQQLASTLIVHYIDKNNVRDKVASRTASVMKDTYTVKGIENGVRIDFEFEKEGFKIPVELELKEDRLCARIISEEIWEASATITDEERADGATCNILSQIELLPYFGAGSTDDEGYVVVPDGSGAMIDFNNGKYVYSDYAQPIYGRDVSETLLRKETTTQDAQLPVYGIKNGDGAMLGVITKNSSAELHASVSGLRTSYNTASVGFRMRGDDTYTLGTTVYTRVQQFLVYEEGGINADYVEMSYFFLDKDRSDYTGMAKRFQEYLIEDEKMTVAKNTTEPTIFLEMYGGVQVTRPVWGLQTDVTQKITGYEDAKNMLEKVLASGVKNVAVRYVNWDNNLIGSKAGGSVSVSDELGGGDAFKDLIKYCNDKNVPLYLDQELQLTNNFGNGFVSWSSGAQTINGTLIRKEGFSIQLLFEDKSKSTRLMSMTNIDEVSDHVMDSFSYLDRCGKVGISTGSFGDTLYSDYRQTGWIRDDSANAIREATAKFAEKYPIMASGGNLPAVLDAESVINLSFSSSRFDIVDRSIPFYQLVMNGAKKYASSAANLTASVNDATLHAIETGSALTFLLSEVDYDDLRDTKLTTLYSIGYDQYAKDVTEAYNTLQEVYDATEGSTITKHSYLQDGVAKTEYANGAVVYVNYNNRSVTADGMRVSSNGYLVVEGGN